MFKSCAAVIESTEKSAKAITKELAPLQEEMKNLSANLLQDDDDDGAAVVRRKKKQQISGKVWTRDTGMNALNFYLNRFNKAKLDKYFGIQLAADNKLMMGDRVVGVDNGSNVYIDNVEYKGTSGLWALIMLASPRKPMYTDEDMRMYRDLVARTHVARYPRGAEKGGRPHSTYKWRTFFAATTASQPSSSSVPSGDDADAAANFFSVLSHAPAR